ncbi:DUF6531 domain-containing protein [Streptomyces profundus]|uniref:DUF6531 domain-containing protein n=1 Tax=Streptomyces profundus TaxID=2867410 RepID=UPI001D15ED64|nr:DUF6531 domain-containing protein [Streptomyces sp. MA3_2.13]UED87584.1 DUF6531 domain-containing protein [Streptomyces sp. MA3_2.13]
MARASDWSPVDMDRDPTPGDPDEVRELADELREFADDVGEALGKIRGLASERAVLDWAGLSADAFRAEFDGVPGNLTKLEESYSLCSQALQTYWPKLQTAQGMADRALDRAISAQADLAAAQSALDDAEDWVGRAGDEAERLQREGEREDIEPPDEDDVRTATRDHQAAEAAAGAARGRVNDAEERLSAARQLAQDAQEMREEAARECTGDIDEASDAGIQNRRWWEKAIKWVTDNWDTLVEICKVIVAVLGVVVMIIGGPLAWVVFAAALVVLADTLIKFARGEAGLLDVAFAALDCIPGMKGLTTLGGLAAGVRGLARSGLRGMAQGVRGLAGRGRSMLTDGMDQAYSRMRNAFHSGGTDPIDLATGKMYLPLTDVDLPGTLPFAFTRRLESGYRSGRWFGPSWSSTVDQRLELDEEGIVLVTEDGMLLAYPHPSRFDEPVLPATGPRWPLSRSADEGYQLNNPITGHTRSFAPPDEAGFALLQRVSDRNGNHVDFDYDAHGAPLAIRHSGGYHLELTTEEGRVTALRLADVDPDGTEAQIKRYGYKDGNLVEVFTSSEVPFRFVYDERLRVTSWTDTNGCGYGYTYDDQDRCVAEGGEAGHVTVTVDYEGTDSAWPGTRITALTTAEGAVTRYVINDRFQVIAIIDPNGAVTRAEYDSHHHLTSWTDALGRTTRYENAPTGQPLLVTRPDGASIHCAYDASAKPTSIIQADGSTWQREYDTRGNCTALIDPTGATTRHTFDANGRLTSVTDPLGATTLVRCNAAGLPEEIVDPLANRVTRRHDAFGRIVEVTDPLGGVSRQSWTAEGRIARSVGPDGAEQTWDYDGEGNCVRHTDAHGGVTTYEFTHFDLLAARTGPDGVRYTFAYDPALRLTQVTNPHDLTWDYAYDPAGRLIAETDFDGRRMNYGRDALGRMTSRVNPLGQTILFQYDVSGRIVTKSVDGASTEYEHDAVGRMVRASGAGCEVLREHDGLGRVVAETVDGETVSFTYDAAGHRLSRDMPSGASAWYAYDAAGRRTSLTTAGRTLSFTHDAAGREVSRLVGEALTMSQVWDPAGRLSEQSVTAAGGLVQHRAYAYRNDGQLLGVDDHLRGTSQFALDDAARVVEVDARNWSETYAYDAVGNQMRASWPANHAGADARGERVHAGTRPVRAGSVAYEYDAAGRITTRRRTRLSRKPDVWRYTWDAEDRLTTVTTPDGTVWRYRYDPFGRRIAKQRMAADGTAVVEETRYAWDGGTVAEQTTTGSALAHPVILTWDHDGTQPLAQTERRVDQATGEEIDARFFAIVTDLVGAPTELVDETGQVAWRSRSTVWGVTTWPSHSRAYTPLRFPGQYFDHETGLHYNVNRYYDPETGGYLSDDPLGLAPAPNPRAYVTNPHTRSDPLGLAPYQRYRTDTRPTEEIFDRGFEPRGDNMNLEEHVAGLGGQYYPESGYVGTTDSLGHAQDRARGSDRYIYDIRANDAGVDVNARLPDNPSGHEREHAYPRNLDPSEIAGAWDPSGNYRENPNFGGRR